MKLNRRIRLGLFIVILLSKVSSVSAYNSTTENTNLSGGIILLFIPVMLGIIYLACKSEIK
ncbi:MAG: hypothetical protein ACLR9T_03190 [Thomasclavelia sp.]|uniref:hypothetical protein n=1 Tax=Thomasclavelia sp. TaxID=3025757 RepID=UPI0039A1ED7C